MQVDLRGEEGSFLSRSKYPTEVRSNHNFKGFKSEEPFFRTGSGPGGGGGGFESASGKNNHEMRDSGD